jgi:hypothetical protein
VLAFDDDAADVGQLRDSWAGAGSAQFAVAAGGLFAAVALITGLLEPAKHKQVAVSSTARYTLDAGGVKARKMGA